MESEGRDSNTYVDYISKYSVEWRAEGTANELAVQSQAK
jgi:hypothetical protein